MKACHVAAVVVSVLLLHGCSSQGRNHRAGTRGGTQFNKAGWAVVYANDDNVRIYEKGRRRALAKNPAGYDSLDYWIGYSTELSAIVFHRQPEANFRLLELDTGNATLRSRILGKACEEECFPHEFSLHDGKLWVVRGKGHKAELWSYAMDNKWERTASWKIPSVVPVSRNWTARPALYGSRVVYRSPSSYLMFTDTSAGTTRVLDKGHSAYKDPGFEDSSVLAGPEIPAGSDWVFYRSASVAGPGGNGLVFSGLNLRTGGRRGYAIPLRVVAVPLFGRPDLVADLQGVPGTDYVACQVYPEWSVVKVGNSGTRRSDRG